MAIPNIPFRGTRRSVALASSANLLLIVLGVLLSACPGRQPPGDAADVAPTDASDVRPMDAVDVPTDTPVDVTVDAIDAIDATDATDTPPACDGSVCGTSCVDTSTDPHHCGSCDNDCTALTGVASTIACVAGQCDLTNGCAAGRGHCSSNPSDGCETDLSSASHCGTCTTVCGTSAPVCTMAAGGTNYVCATGCTGGTPTLCGSSCVDTTTDPNHCGDCTIVCSAVVHGTPTCTSSTCGFTCLTGYHACGSACASNTDVNSCGTSCTACTAPANATATCDGTSCGFVCNAGYHACAGACVIDTSVTACGAACVVCATVTNGTATCVAGACGFTCAAGYHACGGSCVSDTSVTACGASCTVCPTVTNGTATCSSGTCGFTCDAGYHACSGACVSDTSATACGASCTVCPTVTNATATCTSGACGFTCNTGYHTCGSACADDTSIATCGSSCSPCVAPANAVATCTAGTCGYTCAAGWGDCDPLVAGCETDLSQTATCGSCTVSCSGATPVCVGSGGSYACGHPANATCAGATAITSPTTLTAVSTVPGGTSPTGSTCGSAGGPSIYYAVTIPAGSRAIVTVTGATGFDAVVKVLTSCAAADCSSRTDSTSGGGTETVTIDNTASSTDMSRIVVVNGWGSGSTGTFNLNVDYITPAPNSTCAGATTISTPTTLTGVTTTLGGSSPAGTTCGTAGGSTLYYLVSVPANTRATLRATGGSGFDPVLKVLSSCGATDCLSRTDVTASAGSEYLLFDNTTGATTSQIVAVNGYTSGSTGTFDLNVDYVSLASAAPNSTCATATAISTAGTITGENTLNGGAPPTGSTCSTGGPALYYQVTIAAMTRATITVTGGTGFDPAILAEDSCAATNCSSRTNSTGAGGVETLSIDNISTSAITRIIAVDGSVAGTFGTFDIGVAYTAIVLAPNALCATATAITGTTTITGEQLANGGPNPTGTGCGYGSGTKTLYYSVTINPGQVVSVQTTPAIDIVLFTQNSCSDVNCASYSDSSPESTSFTNTGTSPITRIVGIRPYSLSSGTYNISFTYTTVAVNTTCATATPITTTTTITGEQLSSGGSLPGTSCGGGTGTRTLYYSVTINPGDVVVVQTTPAVDIVLMTLNACADTACATYTDSAPESTSFTNTGSSPITRIVAIRPYSASSGTYDIAFYYSSTTPAPNSTCATATAISSTTTITGEQLAGGGAPPSGTGCGSGTGTRTLYYSVTVNPGQSVSVVTAPGVNIVMFTQNSCADTNCTAYYDTSAAPESTSITNLGGSPITRIVGVRPYSLPGGPYNITFTYVPYAITAIPAVCVTGGTWTSLTRSSTTSNDATTATTALPFSMTYFGSTVGYYSTNTNGIAQLWPDATGVPANSWSNTVMPSSAAPNGIVAPFWDDLYLGSAFDIHTQTIGSPGSQTFVIEWADALSGSGGAHITFQAQFYEGTNVIEFHYCSIGTGTNGTGTSATIGMENLTGTVGSMISYNTAGAVATGSGFRFTPL